MTADRQLSRDFRLSEFPCWERATEVDVAALSETVEKILQPTRDRWGRIVPTSWMWWRSGCTPRTGSHGTGGAVDFVALDADLEDVFRWGVDYLLPTGYVGRWIYEPEIVDDDGQRVQGEHIHVAPRWSMLQAHGKGDVGAFVETEPGVYEPYRFGPDFGGASGAYGDPIEIPGLVATVGRKLGRWLALGVFVGAALQGGRARAVG